MAGCFDISEIEGKVVLVTGASAGIGRATAILLARAGANVILTARRMDQLEKVAVETGRTGKGGEIVVAALDLTEASSIDQLVSSLPASLQNMDVLVNNAGMGKGNDEVGDLDDSEVLDMFNANVLGLIRLTQIFVKQFKARNSGHIIQMGSIAGVEAYAGGSVYCATKHAVHAFNVSLRKELVATNIRVTEIMPDESDCSLSIGSTCLTCYAGPRLVETEFSINRFRGDAAQAKQVYQGLQPLTPEDIAQQAAARIIHRS